MNYLEMVEEFHVAMKYRQPTPTKPSFDKFTATLRVRLIQEEFTELQNGLENLDEREVLDALCDLQYVISGAVLALGFKPVFNAAFSEIQRSNLDKLWTSEEAQDCRLGYTFEASPCGNGFIAMRDDGKIIKPPHWTPPDLDQFI